MPIRVGIARLAGDGRCLEHLNGGAGADSAGLRVTDARKEGVAGKGSQDAGDDGTPAAEKPGFAQALPRFVSTVMEKFMPRETDESLAWTGAPDRAGGLAAAKDGEAGRDPGAAGARQSGPATEPPAAAGPGAP